MNLTGTLLFCSKSDWQPLQLTIVISGQVQNTRFSRRNNIGASLENIPIYQLQRFRGRRF